MTGLLLLMVAGAWLFGVSWLANKIGMSGTRDWSRAVLKILVFAVLLPLPLIDEIVGGIQFHSLCSSHTVINFDREKTSGKTIYFEPTPVTHIADLWLPVRLQRWRFVAPETGEVLVSYETLHANGGWLTRTLRISEGNVPLMFKESCAPKEDLRQLFSALQIKVLDKPAQESIGGK